MIVIKRHIKNYCLKIQGWSCGFDFSSYRFDCSKDVGMSVTNKVDGIPRHICKQVERGEWNKGCIKAEAPIPCTFPTTPSFKDTYYSLSIQGSNGVTRRYNQECYLTPVRVKAWTVSIQTQRPYGIIIKTDISAHFATNSSNEDAFL